MQECTTYFFDVKPAALLGALERFAQFFVAPLIKQDAMLREVQAVDNEFAGEAGEHHLQQSLMVVGCCSINSSPSPS
jgi:secreted Zn-dependent insulinase-like peptidase